MRENDTEWRGFVKIKKIASMQATCSERFPKQQKAQQVGLS